MLSTSQRCTLAAICEALVPAIPRPDDPGGLFAASAGESGTAERVERLVGMLADPQDRARLGLLLTALGNPLANLALSGRMRSLAALPPAAREAVLRSWAHSALPLRRAGFQALKRLVHVGFYGWPYPDGSHPAWRATGYPGPLPQPAAAVEPLPEIEVRQDTVLDCDVAVVGSGAGGGVVAGVLAAEGRDVVVLEKGPNPGSRDMTQVEGDMLNALYLDGGLLMTKSGSMPILAGSCVGGGTTINWTTSLPLTEAVRAQWDRASGLPLFGSARFQESLDRVAARANVGTQWNTPGRRDEILERGCRALGWHVDQQPRNVTDCKEGLECGFCGYGCRHGAKNSTAGTYLRDAAAAGARIVSRCDVRRVLVEAGRATGVEAVVAGTNGGRVRLTVRARAVVVAAGAIYTPAVLRRSAVANPRIGRGLSLQPVTAVLGTFPERVEPWGGALQTRYSDQFADLHDGYGVKFETGPAHFSLAASAFGWESARAFREDLARYGHTSMVGILTRDRDTGRVAVGRDGIPRTHYELSAFDVGHVRTGIRAAAELLAAAGAEQVFTMQTPPTRARPGAAGWLDRFMADADRTGYRHCRMSYISFHQLGTAAMGADPRRSVVDERGECHGVRGLYVADGSAFPLSSGVNPMITIMAVADHVARRIAEGW